jgi:hypothetical protein
MDPAPIRRELKRLADAVAMLNTDVEDTLKEKKDVGFRNC